MGWVALLTLCLSDGRQHVELGEKQRYEEIESLKEKEAPLFAWMEALMACPYVINQGRSMDI